jgi:ribosomal protein L31
MIYNRAKDAYLRKFELEAVLVARPSQKIYAYLDESSPSSFQLALDLAAQVPIAQGNKYLVLFDYVLAIGLVALGATDVRVAVKTKNPKMVSWASKVGFSIVTLEEVTGMKFDAVIGNPPYKGKAALHQQFFNLALDHLVEGGTLCFIQPATPYLNKKEKKKSAEAEMIENIKKYKTKVKFTDFKNVFGSNANGITQLAITTLVKESNSHARVLSVEYLNGKKFDNIELEAINMLEIKSTTYLSIRNKYFSYISKHGSIDDRCVQSNQGAYLQQIRGHIGSSDFFTLISNQEKYHVKNTEEKGITIDVSSQEMPFFYNYAKTFVARFGLALSKFNQNNHMGELRTVPLVPFDHNWTDQELAKLIGLTDEELDIIMNILPDYHGLLKTTEEV